MKRGKTTKMKTSNNKSGVELLGLFVTATLGGGLNGEPRQGFVESVEPLILRGESGEQYECCGQAAIVSNPPEHWDPIASYEQAEAALAAGLMVELSRVDQHGRVVEWHEPAPSQLLRGWPLERWRIVLRRP
jgi:hypothetical protein